MSQWLKNLITFFFGTLPAKSSAPVVKPQITDAVTSKKPAANKAAKKPAAKKARK